MTAILGLGVGLPRGSFARPGTLIAPIEGGEYEIWYVTADGETQSTRPVTVADLEVTLDAPDSVAAGASFEVEWTGLNGRATTSPSCRPVPPMARTSTTPASDRVGGTYASIPITVD